MDILYGKDVRSFTMLHTDFLDCEMLNSNEKILLAILMRYDSYGKNNKSRPGKMGGLIEASSDGKC